jgi:hypothetical protein
MNKNDIFEVLIKMAVKQARKITDDQEALELKMLYKQWEKQIGRELTVGEYVQHGDRLYRVLTTHIAQENWEPGVGTESMFVVIDKVHAGTIDDSIPWNANMECEEGKYYSEDGVIYLCIRTSGIALQCKIVDVLGNYFQLAEGEVEVPKEEPQPEEPKVEEPVEPQEPEEEEKEEPTVAEEGSLENPIAYSIGMVVYNGKYYKQNDVVYLCTRDSGNALYHDISALIGTYFANV